MNHDPKRIESNPNPKPRIGSDREMKSMVFFSCRNRRYDNYLPEPLPLPCVRRRPARISSPEDAVDPPELARPHRFRSFVPKSTVTEHATESPNPMSASKIAFWVFRRSYVQKDPKEIKFLFSSLWVPSWTIGTQKRPKFLSLSCTPSLPKLFSLYKDKFGIFCIKILFSKCSLALELRKRKTKHNINIITSTH